MSDLEEDNSAHVNEVNIFSDVERDNGKSDNKL